MMIQGCDISFYQDDNSTSQQIDFNKMKSAGADFVIIRYNQADLPDSDLTYNYNRAKEAGLIVGSYHLYDYRRAVEGQINKTIELLKKYPPTIPPWLDVEYVAMWNYPFPQKKALIDIQRFLQVLEGDRGKKPYFYSNPNTILNYLRLDSESWLVNYPLAIAHYYVTSPSTKPWKGWAFWQYTDKGDGNAYGVESKQIDLDYFSGTYQELVDGWKPKPTYDEALDSWARSMGFDGPPLPK